MAVPQRIVLGTRNQKKAAEIVDHLRGLPIEITSLAEFGQVAEVIEDGTTFVENARKKASELAVSLGEWVLGEDSGLAVDALQGRPGVYSARYSGDGATDDSNNAKLLEELAQTPLEKRTAHYVCTAVLSDPGGKSLIEVEGRCRGRIGFEPVGDSGFGYDPLFIIPEYHKTFAQLGIVAKRHLSHRARALAQFRSGLQSLIAKSAE